VLQALWQSLVERPELAVAIVGLAAAAAALPALRSRGPWGIAALGTGLLAVLLLGAPSASVLPIVAGVWLLCLALGGLGLARER
jgi:hypothetical protein